MNILAYVHLRNIHRSTGAGRVARQLTEHLVQQPGTTVQILADPGDHQRIIPQVGEPWQSFAYHFIEQETSRQQAQWFLWNRPRAEQYWGEAQVVYCTAESYVPKRRSRLAVTLHDAAYFDRGAHRANLAFYKQRLKWRLLYRTLARQADLFHTVSEFSAERISHHYPEIRKRLRVVPNAVSPPFFAPPTEAGLGYLRSAGLADRPYVLLPGGLHFRKNAELVLEAWPLIRQRHPDLKLVVANHSDPAYVERAATLGDSVQLAGFVEDEGLVALYNCAQAVWFPSRYEGFGLPVIEAMACGAPVVASNSSSLPEVAGDAALLVSPTAPGEHAETVSDLLSSPSMQEQLRQRGRTRAARYTWDASARQLLAYFQELV